MEFGLLLNGHFEDISEGGGALLCLSTEQWSIQCSADEVPSRGVTGATLGGFWGFQKLVRILILQQPNRNVGGAEMKYALFGKDRYNVCMYSGVFETWS